MSFILRQTNNHRRIVGFLLVLILLLIAQYISITSCHQSKADTGLGPIVHETGRVKIIITRQNSTSVVISYERPSLVNFPQKIDLKNYDIKITYKLLTLYRGIIAGRLCAEVFFHQHENEYDSCISDLQYFGYYDDPPGLSNNYEKHCQEGSFTINCGDGYSPMSGEKVIEGLLPNVAYRYTIKPIHRSNQKASMEDEKSENMCQDPAEPEYPPQSDIGSYLIHVDPKQPTERIVDILWRPLPTAFQSSPDIMNSIDCYIDDESNRKKFFSSNESVEIGRVTIGKILESQSCLCELRATHPIGNNGWLESQKKSLIRIPKKENTIHSLWEKGFRFFVISTVSKSSEYVNYSLTWTHLSDIYPEYKNFTTVYTIYWCPRDDNMICKNIKGIYKTEQNKWDVTLPTKLRIENSVNYHFGISLRTKNDTLSSHGIHWGCISSKDSQDKYDIYVKASDTKPDEVEISWNSQTCQSRISLIQGFELAYCQLEPLDPCQGGNYKGSHNQSIDFDNNPNCKIDPIENTDGLKISTIVKGLKSSHLYAFGVRYEGAWSKPSFVPIIDPPTNCSSSLTKYVISALVVFLFLSVIYVTTNKFVSHYWTLFRKFKQTSVTVPTKIEEALGERDDQVGIALKFWVNRFSPKELETMSVDSCSSMETNSDDMEDILSESFKDSEQEVGYIQDTTRADYIPRKEYRYKESENPGYIVPSSDYVREADNDFSDDLDEVSLQSHPSLFDAIFGTSISNQNEKDKEN